MSKHYLSATQLNMFFRCPYQYKLRYIDGIKKPPGITILIGRSVDESVTQNLQNKIKTGILLNNEKILDIARDTLNDEWANSEPKLTDEEKKIGIKKIKGQCVDISVKLSDLHYKKVAPLIKPKKVQRKWELEISGYPFDITGYIDIQEDSNIRDTKTTKSKKTGAADKSLQLTVYALAGKIIDKKDYKLYLDFLVNNKEAKYDPQETIRNQKDFEALFKRLEIMALSLEKGIFIPTNKESSYTCSPQYCGYWDYCPYV